MHRRTLLRRRPAAVIFDMDGLMLDTEPLAARAWIDAARDARLAFDSTINHRLIGRNFPDCRTIIREHHGADYPVDDLMGAWHGAYDAIVEREGIALQARAARAARLARGASAFPRRSPRRRAARARRRSSS